MLLTHGRPSIKRHNIWAFPLTQACAHIRLRNLCNVCYNLSEKTGPIRCDNPKCKGHSEANQQCFGTPPVIRNEAFVGPTEANVAAAKVEKQAPMGEPTEEGPEPPFSYTPPRAAPSPVLPAPSTNQQQTHYQSTYTQRDSRSQYFDSQFGEVFTQHHGHPDVATAHAINMQPAAQGSGHPAPGVEEDEEATLERILALSMQESTNHPASYADDDDADFRAALQASQQPTHQSHAHAADSAEDEAAALERTLAQSLEDSRRPPQSQAADDDDDDADFRAAREASNMEASRPAPHHAATDTDFERILELSRRETTNSDRDEDADFELALRLSRADSDLPLVTKTRARPPAPTSSQSARSVPAARHALTSPPAPSASQSSTSIAPPRPSASNPPASSRPRLPKTASTSQASSSSSSQPPRKAVDRVVEPWKKTHIGFENWKGSVESADLETYMETIDQNDAEGKPPEFTFRPEGQERRAEIGTNDRVTRWQTAAEIEEEERRLYAGL